MSNELANNWWLSPVEIEAFGLHGQADTNPSGYLSERAWKHVVMPVLNPPHWDELLHNKWLFAQYCSRLNVRIPRTIGYVHANHGFDLDRTPLRCAADLVAIVDHDSADGFVMKPIRGEQGEGILIVDHVEDGVFIGVDGHEMNSAELDRLIGDAALHDGFIIERRLKQATWFDSFAGLSNSLRVHTFLPKEGEPIVQSAILRMGRVNQIADNWAQGGIAVQVDVATGKLGRGRLKPKYGGTWH